MFPRRDWSIAAVACAAGLLMAPTPPAEAQTSTSIPIVQRAAAPRVNMRSIARLAGTKPNYIPQLAAIRQTGIAAGQGASLKGATLRQYIKGMSPPTKLAQTKRKRNVLSKIKESVSLALSLDAGEQESIGAPSDGLVPVGFLPPPAPPADALSRRAFPFGTSWHFGEASSVIHEGGKASLGNGEVLIAASDSVEIDMDEVKVALQPGSVVLLQRTDAVWRIVSLIDKHKDDIVVTVCGQSTPMRPSQEFIIGRSDDAILACKRWHQCGRKSHKMAIACAGHHNLSARLCEISIPSLVAAHPLVQRTYRADDRESRRLSKRLVKMSACMAHCTKSRASFSWEN